MICTLCSKMLAGHGTVLTHFESGFHRKNLAWANAEAQFSQPSTLMFNPLPEPSGWGHGRKNLALRQEMVGLKPAMPPTEEPPPPLPPPHGTPAGALPTDGPTSFVREVGKPGEQPPPPPPLSDSFSVSRAPGPPPPPLPRPPVRSGLPSGGYAPPPPAGGPPSLAGMGGIGAALACPPPPPAPSPLVPAGAVPAPTSGPPVSVNRVAASLTPAVSVAAEDAEVGAHMFAEGVRAEAPAMPVEAIVNSAYDADEVTEDGSSAEAGYLAVSVGDIVRLVGDPAPGHQRNQFSAYRFAIVVTDGVAELRQGWLPVTCVEVCG